MPNIGASKLNFIAQTAVAAGATTRAHTIALKGNAQHRNRNDVTSTTFPSSKFGGGGLLLDGTGDAIHLQPENSGDFVFNGEFTFEFFFAYEQTVSSQASATLLSNRLDTGGIAATDFFILWRNFDDKLQVYTPDLQVAAASGTLTEDEFHHVVLCRDASGNQSFFVDGTRQQTVSGSTNPIGLAGSREAFGIGGFVNGSGTVTLPFNQGTNGYIDEVRISSVDRYGASNSSLTVPTKGFANDSDTKALLHMNGPEGTTENFVDDTSTSGRTTRGGYLGNYLFGASVPTLTNTRSKFGTSSLELDGTTSYGFGSFEYENPGSSPFTHEGWFYPTNVSGNKVILSAQNNNLTAQLFFLVGSNLQLYMNNASNASWGVVSGTSFGTANVNQWNHFALCRTGDTLELFLNGTRGNTVRLSAGLNLGAGNYETNTRLSTPTSLAGFQENAFRVGLVEGTNAAHVGSLGPFRISNTARYTGSSYTQPTGNFVNDANTLSIFNMDEGNGTRNIKDSND